VNRRAWLLSMVWLVCGAAGLAAQEITVLPNLTYAEAGDVKLQLDLILPKEGEGPYPGLVLIHGGGWVGGTRHVFRPKAEEAARKGYVTATISYRLTNPDKTTGKPEYPFPAQIHDCKAAVRWLRAHAAEYKLDPRRIGVMGASAGGHLSLLVGLTDPKDDLEGELGPRDASSRVQAVVNIFGPTDLLRCFETSPGGVGFLKALCNGTPEDSRELYVRASPVHYVTNDDPPVLTLHGEKDTLVPVEQAQLLDAKLKAAGVTHELVVLKDQGHGFQGEAAQQAEQAAWDFLARHLMPSR